jgi:hypothetical protein
VEEPLELLKAGKAFHIQQKESQQQMLQII